MSILTDVFGKGGNLDDYIKILIKKINREENN